MRTSSLTITPPALCATFHSRPHSLGLMVVLPSKPTTFWPHGEVLKPMTSASTAIGREVPRIARSPWTLYWSPPTGTIEVLWNVRCGRLPTSKKSADRQLRDLVDHGIVTRAMFPEIPPQGEYALIPNGVAAVSVVESLRAYGDAWLMDDHGDGAEGDCTVGSNPATAGG